MKNQILTIILCLFTFVVMAGGPVDNGNGTATYKGETYEINVGPKGGKYIICNGSKIYLSTDKSVENGAESGVLDNGDGTATYKGNEYPIEIGPKGGRFIVVNGVKKYLPKATKAVI